jgi:hypothetical protein
MLMVMFCPIWVLTVLPMAGLGAHIFMMRRQLLRYLVVLPSILKKAIERQLMSELSGLGVRSDFRF